MKKIVALLVLLTSLAGSAVCAVNSYVLYVTKDDVRSYESVSAEKYDCIMVLGAGLRSDGTPSDMLRDRLDMAILLYKSGMADTIILSGDKSDGYDEVSAMKTYCTGAEIPEECILTDYTGFSTYESMNNLKFSHPDAKIIVVTQAYHLYRAVFIGTEMNLDVTGVCADFNSYYGQTSRTIREAAARFKDFIKVTL